MTMREGALKWCCGVQGGADGAGAEKVILGVEFERRFESSVCCFGM